MVKVEKANKNYIVYGIVMIVFSLFLFIDEYLLTGNESKFLDIIIIIGLVALVAIMILTFVKIANNKGNVESDEFTEIALYKAGNHAGRVFMTCITILILVYGVIFDLIGIDQISCKTIYSTLTLSYGIYLIDKSYMQNKYLHEGE